MELPVSLNFLGPGVLGFEVCVCANIHTYMNTRMNMCSTYVCICIVYLYVCECADTLCNGKVLENFRMLQVKVCSYWKSIGYPIRTTPNSKLFAERPYSFTAQFFRFTFLS